MSIPDSITKEHCLKAIQDIDAGVAHDFGEPTRWALVHNGVRYAPKAVLGIAAKYATGKMLGPYDLHGGEGAGRANTFLRKLGFQVVERTDSTMQDIDESPVPPIIADEILRVRDRLLASGDLLNKKQLNECYARFRQKFGPERLARLNGEDLLMEMHAHGVKDSLVYWLEFKDDEELPGKFGGIGGGSAFKFGVFQRKETGQWVSGSPQKPKNLSVQEAIRVAESNRKQLLEGCEILEKFVPSDNDGDYEQLRVDLNGVAPDLSNSAWGHKYFALLFPEKLDDFHSSKLQRFFLTHLLQIPPKTNGRFVCTGRFYGIAKALGISLYELTSSLNRWRPKHGYWRIGTRDGSTNNSQWERMRDGENVAIGWAKLGDLSNLISQKDSKQVLKEMLASTAYSDSPISNGQRASQINKFVKEIAAGDVVIACDGGTVLGIGRVIGDYEFVAEDTFPHKRPVEWLNLDAWKFANRGPGLRTTVYRIWPGKWPDAVVEVNSKILGAEPVKVQQMDSQPKSTARAVPTLSGIQGRCQAILRRKAQVILYGPPGTGKSYWAKQTAEALASWSVYGVAASKLDETQRRDLYEGTNSKTALIRTCCFHPAYGYEDFIEGYRPETSNERMVFNLRDGIFKNACSDAASHPDQPYFLIIDEINRGDIPRIFGELLHGIEADKRGSPLTLSVSGTELSIPKNLFLIGTMNTADRSIALFDTALRRRFGFVEMMPDYSVLGDAVVGGIPLGPWLSALNRRICQYVGRDARNLQVGHAYFLEGGKPVETIARLSKIVREDLIPLLQEYCYEDYLALENILGKGLVDAQGQTIKDQIFDPDAHSNLIAALIQPCPDLITSVSATVSDDELDDDAEEISDDDDMDSTDA